VIVENKTLESKKIVQKNFGLDEICNFFLTQMSSKKVVVDEICTFIFLHKFHSKELQWGAFLKNPLKRTTFIQKTYELDKIYSSFFAQISSKRGIKRTPRKHLFVWMKYALHFLHKFHSKEELRKPIHKACISLDEIWTSFSARISSKMSYTWKNS